MATPLTPELAESVAAWIQAQAERMQIAAKAHPEGITQNGEWLDVPVSLDAAGDAYDRAGLLQQIEDAWEPEAHAGLRLFLRPTGRVPTKEDDYAELAELMVRQNIILGRMGERGITDEDAERFKAMRENWEERLREMEHRYPSLRNGAR